MDNTIVTFPGDTDDFSEEDSVLNYRPSLEWEEPDSIPGDEIPFKLTSEVQKTRERTESLINGYKQLAQLAASVQKKLDDQVKKSGGFTLPLDPVKDAITISAMKRRFPEVDSGTITYDIYKKALACIRTNQQTPALVTSDDIKKATYNPSTTSFGGIDSAPGKLRSEIVNPMGNPVDLVQYQKDAIDELYEKMEDSISGNSSAAVLEHELAKHSK